jgi:arylsulfatase A-like enzyme
MNRSEAASLAGSPPLAGLLLLAALALTPDWAHARTITKPQADRWVIEQARLRVTVDPQAGRLSVLDQASGYEWRQAAAAGRQGGAPAFREVRAVPDGLTFVADFGMAKGRTNVFTVTLRVPAGSGDLCIQADMADRSAPLEYAPFLAPLLLDTPQGAFAVADYSNGHLYPLDLKPFRAGWLGGDRLNMPWVGVCDLERGLGYALILETSDDAAIESKPYAASGREVHAPRVAWLGSQGTFAYPRRLIYRFVSQGGYVALAKAYRAYAKEQGLLVTLAEKAKRNPNVRRLFGAADVWGSNDDRKRDFAAEAKAAGIERMILHGTAARERMQAANALGYLTSEYDNYTDIQPLAPGAQPDSHHDLLPDRAVLKADGQRMNAWLTYDKKTQFLKRCPTFWLPTAKLVLPKTLAAHPFLGRFIDVTTAESLYECYDPQHPLTRGDKRRCGEQLLAYARSLGLVVGGEHGIWWAVPHLDYLEGMMSSYQFAWPAGHLIRPKDRTEQFAGPYGADTWENYERWGIGHAYRVPLWELVFHDCVVSTWYWGDASDWLLQVDKANAAKKDAFNILYGTIPLLWVNRQGAWQADRELFLRTCRNTSRLHQAVAQAEMLSHAFLTPDRAVQQTRFSDGTEVVVNFGATPWPAKLRGRTYLLPQNGFAAKGPRLEQSLALVDGRPVTSIRAPGYSYTDRPGKSAAARRRPPNVIFILADDLGWTDLGCQSSTYYQTPAIDRLAAQGVRFTSFYSCQNCVPTRAALMTGQYAPRTGMFTVGSLERGQAEHRRLVPPANRTDLPLDRTTIARALKAAGYATALFGKWHLGQKGDYHPARRGFDEAIVSMGRHFDFVTDPPAAYPPGTYLADFLTDKALDFIERHRDRPFFLYLAHFGVHSPHEAKPELIAKHAGKAPIGGHRSPIYAAMIESVDQSVARVQAKLAELKLTDDTVIIFTSDNGGVGGYAAAGVKAHEITDNAPLRGGKGMLYEGGVRVPFLVRWPGVIPAGAVCDEPALHVDLFPTLLELAGGSPPAGQPLDGLSLAPLFQNPRAKLPREAIYAHFPGYLEGRGAGAWRTTPVGWVRARDFKLLEFFEDGRLELYNLKDDLGEKQNLAEAQPQKTAHLHGLLKAWRQTLKAPMPQPKDQRAPSAEARPATSP